MSDTLYSYTFEDLSPVDGVQYGPEVSVSSVVAPGGVVYKSAKGFQSIPQAYDTLSWWKEQGWSGAPAGAASCYRKMFSTMRRGGDLPSLQCSASANSLVGDRLRVGWIEAVAKGVVSGPLYHYDINGAFLWAGLRGLPTRVRPYTPGAKRWAGLVDVRATKRSLPAHYEAQINRIRPVLLTHEDVRYYGIRGDVVQAVQWDEEGFTPAYVLASLQGLPGGVFKRVTQSYWGVHAQRKPLQVRHRKGGKVVKRWSLYNREQNLIWATIIGHRVTRHVHRLMRQGGVLCFVDSCLCPVPPGEVDIGARAGQWKLLETFPRGVYIKGPGIWDRLHDHAQRKEKRQLWYKHAGYSAHIDK